MHKMKFCLSGHSNSTVRRTSRQFNTTRVRVYRQNGVKRSKTSENIASEIDKVNRHYRLKMEDYRGRQ